jgi:hypothetical protein
MLPAAAPPAHVGPQVTSGPQYVAVELANWAESAAVRWDITPAPKQTAPLRFATATHFAPTGGPLDLPPGLRRVTLECAGSPAAGTLVLTAGEKVLRVTLKATEPDRLTGEIPPGVHQLIGLELRPTEKNWVQPTLLRGEADPSTHVFARAWRNGDQVVLDVVNLDREWSTVTTGTGDAALQLPPAGHARLRLPATAESSVPVRHGEESVAVPIR